MIKVTVPGTNVTISFLEGTNPQTIDRVMRQVYEQSAPKRDDSAMAERASKMTHEQMVDTYRSLPKDDPFVGFLAAEIAKPRKGETSKQAQDRAYGKISDAPGSMGTTGRAAATFLQGVPFAGEWMDEALAKIASITGPNDEQTNLRAVREGRDQFQKDNPKTSLGLQMAGATTGGLVAAGALPWYAPQSLAGRVAYGAGGGVTGGAAEGAVSGYGAGTDPESRAEAAKSRALVGSALGAVLGSGAPLLQAGASGLIRKVLDRVNIRGNAERAGLSRPSYELLTRAAEADGAFQNPFRGGDAMAADSGPASAGLLDAVIQSGGEASRIGREAVEGRASRSLQTVNQALDQSLGTPQGIQTMEEGIRQGTSTARRTTYEAAYSQPIDYSVPEGQQLEQWFRQIPGDVLQRANRLMQVRREPASAQILLRQQPDGSFAAERLPDVRQWDYITRAMNDVAQSNDGQGALGGQTAIGAGFQEFSRDIRSTLRGLVSDYGVALDTAADAIDARNALRFGESLLSPGTTRDEVARTLAGYSAAERRHAALGVRSRIDEVLANVKRAAGDSNMDARESMQALRELSSRGAREKVTALLGQAQADPLFAQLDQAGQALGLRAATATNSKTAARQELQGTLKDYTDEGIVNRITSGEGINAFKTAVQSLFNTTASGKQAARDRVASEVAQFLTAQNPQTMMRLLQQIATQNPRNLGNADQAAWWLTGAAAPNAYQIGQQYTGRAAPSRGPR
jgi:hypothetical protein